MRYFIIRTLWLLLYLVILIAPLYVLLIGAPLSRGFRWDLATALGFLTVSIVGMQFALTARFKRATAPFGIDIIYHFHKYIGIIALAFIIVHAFIFLRVYRLNPLAAFIHFKAGSISALAVLVVTCSSLLRKKLNIEYDYWRLVHIVLSVTAIIAAIIHIAGIGYYTDAAWKRVFWGVLAAGWLSLVVHVRFVKPLRVLGRPYVVEQLREERGDNWTIRVRPEGNFEMTFLPGQFAWISIWHSPLTPREHPFSIASSAEAVPTLEFTIKQRGDFTRKIKTLKPGDRVYVDAPYGSFSMENFKARGYVFIAGGIGIAPIMSMLRTLADREDRRPLLLFYSNKRWERVAFREEIESLRKRIDLTIVHVLEQPHEGWQGERGFIDEKIIKRYIPEERASREYLICGPVPMMDSCERALIRLGVPISRFHSELFEIV